jgi:hypothetical protein
VTIGQYLAQLGVYGGIAAAILLLAHTLGGVRALWLAWGAITVLGGALILRQQLGSPAAGPSALVSSLVLAAATLAATGVVRARRAQSRFGARLVTWLASTAACLVTWFGVAYALRALD